MKKLIIYIITILAFCSYAWAEEGSEIIWEQSEGQFTTDDFILSEDESSFYSYSAHTVFEISTINGEIIRKIDFEEYFQGGINSIDVNDENGIMAVTGNNEYILIWDLLENQEVKRLTVEMPILNTDRIENWYSVSISPNAKYVVGIAKPKHSDNYTKLAVFDLFNGVVVYEDLRNYRDDSTPKWKSCKFSQSGEYLVTQLDKRFLGDPTDRDDSIFIYETKNYGIVKEINNNFERNVDRGYYLSNYNDILGVRVKNTLEVYDLENNTQSTKEFENYPYSFRFFNNTDEMVVNIYDQTILYNYQTKNIIANFNLRLWARTITSDNQKAIGLGGKGIICVSKPISTGLPTKSKNLDTVFPNPATNEIKVFFNNIFNDKFQYKITTVDGRLVKTENLGLLSVSKNEVVISISDLLNQIYFLEVFSDRESFTFKIIKE